MPKPIPVAIRRQIVQRHQAGETLTSIAQDFVMPYESVRNVWRLYRREGRILPNYAVCGRQGVSASRRVYRAALFLKGQHPTWGAGLIRQVITDKWSDEHLPHERSLQRWFRAAGIHTPRRKQSLSQPRRGRGKVPHNIWEMDSREQIRLDNGELVSWLLVSDEHSGAILDGEIFPQSPCRSIDSTRSAYRIEA